MLSKKLRMSSLREIDETISVAVASANQSV